MNDINTVLAIGIMVFLFLQVAFNGVAIFLVCNPIRKPDVATKCDHDFEMDKQLFWICCKKCGAKGWVDQNRIDLQEQMREQSKGTANE